MSSANSTNHSKLPVFVTGNLNKVNYTNKTLGFELKHTDLDLTEVQPSNNDPREVIEHKVREAYAQLGIPVLVEDTSMTFNALSTLPGPLVKAFVQMDPNPALDNNERMRANLEKMCRMLDGFEDRSAHASAIYGYYDGTETKFFTGRLEGTITQHPRGTGGYGWDPIFEPSGYGGLTRAELTTEQYLETYAQVRNIKALQTFLQSL